MGPVRITIGVCVVVVWIAALVGFGHIIREHVAQPNSNATAIVGYSAALVALAGLMVHAWIAVRNSRKQHTMDVLLQTRLNPQFSKHAGKIQKTFPGQMEIASEILNQEDNKEVKESVAWILDYYEFVSTGIIHGDLDERLMRDCICTQFCIFCYRVGEVIKAERHEDELGNPSVARKRVFKSVVWLQKRWQRKINYPLIPFWWPL